MDVEQEGPAGVAVIGNVTLAAGEFPDEPGIDGAEEDFAPLGPFAQPVLGVQQMFDFRAREIGVNDQAGFAVECFFEPLGFELVADGGTDAALPDDRVGHRSARLSLPEDRGFPLVGHADGGDVLGRERRFLECLAGDVDLRGPDRLGIMLDQARGGQDLLEFFLSGRDNPSVAAEDDRAARGGSLIESENVFLHERRPCES